MLYWAEQWNDVSNQWETYAGAKPEMIRMCNLRRREEAEEMIRLAKIWDEVNTEHYGIDFRTEYRIMVMEV